MLLRYLFVEDELLNDRVMRLRHFLQNVLQLLVDEPHRLLHDLMSELLNEGHAVLLHFAQMLRDVRLDLLLQQLGKIAATKVALVSSHLLIVLSKLRPHNILLQLLSSGLGRDLLWLKSTELGKVVAKLLSRFLVGAK